MYLFSRLFQAARAWRNGGRPKTAKRSAVAVEQLDHRRLLSVNFTGNVATDFPATNHRESSSSIPPTRRHYHTGHVILRKSDPHIWLRHFGDRGFL